MLAHLRRGETYQRRGDLEAAARDFRTAAALDPTATRPLEELGDVALPAAAVRARGRRLRAVSALDDRVAARQLQARARPLSRRQPRRRAGRARQAVRPRRSDRPTPTTCWASVSASSGGRATRWRRSNRRSRCRPGSIPAREELAELYGVAGPARRRARAAAGASPASIATHVERQVGARALAQARAPATKSSPC